jgi:hypothetical protein
LDAEPTPALSAGDPSGDVQQSVAQRLRLGLGQMPVQQQVLGPDLSCIGLVTTAEVVE